MIFSAFEPAAEAAGYAVTGPPRLSRGGLA